MTKKQNNKHDYLLNPEICMESTNEYLNTAQCIGIETYECMEPIYGHSGIIVSNRKVTKSRNKIKFKDRNAEFFKSKYSSALVQDIYLKEKGMRMMIINSLLDKYRTKNNSFISGIEKDCDFIAKMYEEYCSLGRIN